MTNPYLTNRPRTLNAINKRVKKESEGGTNGECGEAMKYPHSGEGHSLTVQRGSTLIKEPHGNST